MNNEPDQFDEELEGLKKQYQRLKAPTYLQTRIRAHTNNTVTKRRMWRPALVAIPLALAVFGILPFVFQQDTQTTVGPKLPSLTALASLKPSKPAAVSLGLGRVRTVSTPPMPQKPKADAADDPQTNIETDEIQKLEENDYEYV